MTGPSQLGYELLSETIGIKIKILSNDYTEIPVSSDINNTYQKIVFQIEEDEPDIFAFGVLFALSVMSFSFSAPRGLSEIEFRPDEDWNIEYFLRGLEFKRGHLCFSADYVSGRLMKTDIAFEPGGKVTLTTRNRAKGAERWLTHLQGEKHIRKVK